MRALVLGASGFIGAHVARAFAAAGWSVRAGARDPAGAAARAPQHEWVDADFSRLKPADWAGLLEGIDVVINCVGVLQDGGGDSLAAAHLSGPHSLFAACSEIGVSRLIHISAIGADAGSGAGYGETKAETEAMLAGTTLDWVILRPSLVMAHDAYGGTALLRGLAAFPICVPVVGGGQLFRPVWVGDLALAIVNLAAPGSGSRLIVDVAGPQAVDLAGLVTRLRGWLGLSRAPIVRVPSWLAAPVLLAGDVLGHLGWPSPLRTTSIKQMAYNVEGDPDQWSALANVRPLTVDQMLSEHPASSADRWQARLYFVRPLSILVLGVFWIITGLVSLGPGRDAAMAVLKTGGFGQTAPTVLVLGGLLDVVLGLALWRRPWTARVALIMALSTVGYLIAGTLSLPQFWIDPMGPWLKVIPMMALCLFIAATDDRR